MKQKVTKKKEEKNIGIQNKDDDKKKVISESFVRSLYLFARAISEMKVIDELYDFSYLFSLHGSSQKISCSYNLFTWETY